MAAAAHISGNAFASLYETEELITCKIAGIVLLQCTQNWLDI